ncbi:MAG TPA: phage holin family protein [Chthoniobacterales bacterium]|nr:phage holin family protein [Chthoniobacterales bacterium]
MAARGADFFFAAGLAGADLGAGDRFRDDGTVLAGAGEIEAVVSPVEAAGGMESVFVFLGTGRVKIGFESIRGALVLCKRIFAKRLRRPRLFAYGAAVRHFVFRWIVTTIAVMVASALLSGIRYDTVGALIGAALLLGIFNAFVRPVLLLLSAPLILLSLGLFILIINGLMLFWVPTFVPGFHVDGFGTAIWGALIVGLISWMLSAFFRGSDGRVHVLTHHNQIKQVHGRVVGPNEASRP